jgi:hypothetical protein
MRRIIEEDEMILAIIMAWLHATDGGHTPINVE